jgi:hypothetical protein
MAGLAANKIAYGGTGALAPMVAEIGLSKISSITGAPSDLFIASRGINDRAIYAFNLGRFIARDVVTNIFGLRIGADDTEFARAQWGDIPDISNLFEHMVALLALPRAAWTGIASKQCGTLWQPTRIVIPPVNGGTAKPGMCPMRVWQDGTSGGPVASATGGLMHKWMHMDFALRNVSTWSGFGSTFKFNETGIDPAQSGLRACESAAWCGSDPCELAGDDHGTGESNTTDFADGETTLRRWDNVRVCVSSRNGPAGRRYQGGVAWYDVGTSDHAFINTAVLYRWYGDELRDMVFADKIHGNSQLQERYDWVKKNYFGDVEYNGRRSGTLPQTNRSLGYFGMPNQ